MNNSSQPAALAHRFHGTWRLVSYECVSGSQEPRFPLGEDAVGLLVYSSDGFMSGQVMKRGHTSASEYIAYCGPFHVDEDAGDVVHRVEASLLARWIGTEQRRHFEFAGDDLILTAITERDGAMITYRLIWRRAR
ncbi:MAG: lipocalin-like domain-containing protein [Bryobacterales bacterium]|nr:lipocalin-like domain-containing protein [Bryobacterales bacterium]